MASGATYAEKADRDDVTAQQIRGKPVFVKHRDIPETVERAFHTEDMYKTLCRTVSSKEISGIQKIKGLWRLYIETQKARIDLITQGLKIRNVQVAVYDSNPFLSHDEDTIRVLVKDIPLSASDTMITDELEKRKYNPVGKIIHQRLRVDGKLTDCLTGDRVLYLKKPSQSLPRFITFGLFRARVFHPGQLPPESSVTCSRCLSVGHHRSNCTKDVICKHCNRSGHIARDCKEDFPPLPSQSVHVAPPGDLPSDPLSGNPVHSAASTRDLQSDTPPAQHVVSQHTPDAFPDSRSHTATPARDQVCDTPTVSQYASQLPSNVKLTHGSSQAKITQYVASGIQRSTEREIEECASNSHDEYSTADSEDDESEQSELSAESPELIKPNKRATQKGAAMKRKQKSSKRLSKKK